MATRIKPERRNIETLVIVAWVLLSVLIMAWIAGTPTTLPDSKAGAADYRPLPPNRTHQ